MPFAIVLSLALLLIGGLIGEPHFRDWQRERIRRRPFPPAWRRILRRRVPYFRTLPADLQAQLKQHIQVFVAEKTFVGCGGQDVTDEVRVTIAAQACLLLLNGARDYFPRLREILVYPSAFMVDRIRSDNAGVLQEQRHVLAGESWARGQVILSWQDTLAGAADTTDGHNVVIHEFAHQLDQEKGYANGAPLLPRRADYARWSATLGEAFAELQNAVALEQPSLLNHYGASDPAEFFAVASEVFFEQAAEMAQHHPALYRELSRFYRVDPAAW